MSQTSKLEVLIVDGSPEPCSQALLRVLAQRHPFVIAVDRGVDHCMVAGVRPSMFVGDLDTASKDALAWARNTCGSEKLFSPEKDDTDFGLACTAARNRALMLGRELTLHVACAFGGRQEHALGVFGVMAANADLAPTIIDDEVECKILAPEGQASWQFGADVVGMSFSAIALAANTRVTERGMHWEVSELELPPLSDRGISNVIETSSASVTCDSGVLAAFLRYH